MVVHTGSTATERQTLLPVTTKYGSVSYYNAKGSGRGAASKEMMRNESNDKTTTFGGRWKLVVAVGASLLVLGQILVLVRQRCHVSRHNNNSHECKWTNLHCSPTNGNNNINNGDYSSKIRTCWIRPSEYETCLQRIQLDTQHFLQSVQAVDDTFAQWYPFYNQAAHPLETRPSPPDKANHYEIYSHSSVDLHALLNQVQTHVRQEDRATMASVWHVSEAFNMLRDAHVNAVKGKIGNLTSNFWSGWFDLSVFPPETWAAMQVSTGASEMNGANPQNAVQIKAVFYYDPNVDLAPKDVKEDKNHTTSLRMNIEQYDQAGNLLATRRVSRLDGLTPGEFILRLAQHAPISTLALRSVGSRVNSLLDRNFCTTHPQSTLFKLWRTERIVPHHLFPDDSFVVEYANDGAKETFYVGIAVTSDDVPALDHWPSSTASDDTLMVNVRDIERQANEPSCLFRNFAIGSEKARNAQHPTNTNNKQRRTTDNAVTEQNEQEGEIVLENACDIDQNGWWTKAFRCSKGFRPPYDDDGPLEMGYKIMDDVLVFKLDSFDGPPDIIFPIWKEINRVASEKGINKLMIDISKNGGGEVPLGMYLAQLMYPEVSCEMLQNKYDMSYNEPMALWAKFIAPVLNELSARWSEMSDEDKVYAWRQVSETQLKEIVTTAEAMCVLDLDHKDDFCGNVETVHETCPLLLAAQSLLDTSSLETFAKFVDTYLDFMETSNPWTALTEFDVHLGIGERTSIRGGKPTNFTNFLKHEPDFPVWWNCPDLDEINVFSQYILVGNGNSGSTTNTFQTTVEQIWKNRETSGAQRPATMVSYGGLGEDTPLTQYAGGTVDDRVNVEVPYAGVAGLPLLTMLFAGDALEHAPEISRVADLLHQKLPQVPYYFEHFSRLPAVEIYNKFLYDNGETVPLEFIYFPPDYHIRDVYVGGVFDNPQAFEKLYDRAARYFGDL